jgi:hypothetical protein
MTGFELIEKAKTEWFDALTGTLPLTDDKLDEMIAKDCNFQGLAMDDEDQVSEASERKYMLTIKSVLQEWLDIGEWSAAV